MFNSKKEALFSKTTSDTNENSFVKAAMKKGSMVLSENGAVKYNKTDNEFVTQFALLGNYKSPRKFADISEDQSTLWAKNPLVSVKFIHYIRMITRTQTLFDGTQTDTVQRGAGLKYEAIMRMFWLALYDKEVFQQNLPLFVTVGSWKDIFVLLSSDLQYNGWEKRMLDWNFLGKFILAGLENPTTSELVKKYLPQIKSNTQCRTIEAQADNMIAKWVCSLLFGGKSTEDTYKNYKQYRLLKTSGTAHQWQQLISQNNFLAINFNTIAGRALGQLVSGNFLANNNLETEYEQWISTKPIAKFTGYPHQLFAKIPQKKYQIDTVNAQFKGLVATAKKDAAQATSMIVVRDTSGSMGGIATGTTMSCFNIAKALALFFSEMLPEGHFADSWIEFNSSAKMHQWKGTTPYEKWTNDRSSFVGSTNFQSVVELFVQIKQTGVEESEFPSGIICISDCEFNSVGLETNYKAAMKTLETCFSQEYVDNFKVVLWNLQRRGAGDKFETYEADTKNMFYFSGYDASVMAFLTGTTANTASATPKNAQELFWAAMNQEILNLVTI